jgi:sigma-B regulation protein RsbU (phosphoserine phosphatase)
LCRLRQAERDKARAIDLFLATLGHDLRNPLGTIDNGLDLLRDSPTMSTTDRETITRMQRTLDRMTRMVDQLLVFTQTMSDPMASERERVDLSQLCEVAIRDHALSGTRRIEFDAVPSTFIRGDADKLHQLLDNLVGNALRHGDGAVSVRVTKTVDRAELCVHNRGPAIPAEALGTLFDPFTRAGGRKGGFGLGLYIVDQIARTHRATVTVESTEAAGTTFVVSFPLDA